MKSSTLDIEQPQDLLDYLRARGHIAPDEQPQIRPLSGGVSNRTVRVERTGGEAWVLKQALEKLRVPVDWFSSPERVHREALGLRWLQKLAPTGTTPALIFEDHTHHLIGMEAVPHPHANWKSELLAGRLDLDHVDQFARLLATIHEQGYRQRTRIEPVFRDRTFFDSLRLEPYYAYTATQVPAAADFLNTLIEQTRARRITLVHGDYSPKNILIYQGRLILLDHEVIHFGDPAFDLGFSMTHFLSKAHHLPAHRSRFIQAAQRHWHVYRHGLGDHPWARTLEPIAVRHTLACLLARVCGRSPLEYLNEEERARQAAAVVQLLDDPPPTIARLAAEFDRLLDKNTE